MEDWSFRAWAWLLRNRGGLERIAAMHWVTPTREFFPPTDATGEARAEYLFDCVKRLMGMAEWPCRLRAYERVAPSQRVAEHVVVRTPRQPNGLFWRADGGGEPRIEYALDLIDQPMVLAAAFAHELSHYLIDDIDEPIPGGDDVLELVTELGVAASGFGLFGANTAFSFTGFADPYSQGFRVDGQGYLSQRTWAHALAVFGALKGEPAPTRFLKPDVAKLVKSAENHLERNPGPIEALKAIVPA